MSKKKQKTGMPMSETLQAEASSAERITSATGPTACRRLVKLQLWCGKGPESLRRFRGPRRRRQGRRHQGDHGTRQPAHFSASWRMPAPTEREKSPNVCPAYMNNFRRREKS